MRDFDPTASEYISSGYIFNNRPGGLLYDFATIAGAVAGPLIGGLIGGDASSKAADAQGQAAAQSDATQRYFYDQTRADNAPFRNTGLAANNRLAQLMGLSVPNSGGVNGGQRLTREGLQNSLLNQFTTTPPPIPGYGSYAPSGEKDGYTAPPQVQASTVDQMGLNREIERQLAQQDAYDQTQATAQSQDPSFGSMSRQFGASDLAADPLAGNYKSMLQSASPDYMQPLHRFGQADLNNDLVYQNGLQFGLDQGTQGINRQAAAGGNFLSGATLKALTRFGNDYGTTKTAGAYDRFTNDQNNRYNQFTTDQNNQYSRGVDSFNRFNTNQDRNYNKLAGLAGTGQVATNQVSAAGQNVANQISASQQGLGNARGSNYLNQGNNMQNAINSGISGLRNSSYGNNNLPGFGSGGGFFGGGRTVPDYPGAEY
jgi:hypothetical protein